MDTHENMDEQLPDFLEKKGTPTGPAPTGFRLPAGYFEKFGDRFFETLHAGGQENAASEAAFLGEINDVGDGFSELVLHFHPKPSRNFSASSAAMQPVPALVTACR